ncbi:hypothetical protein F5Y19DRAFT_473134 [Xylariaceae sp. FL1651]|nr:hypothetical protein F5Y19DRAFT_473134 [Xylariaceae sp. FL1651]
MAHISLAANEKAAQGQVENIANESLPLNREAIENQQQDETARKIANTKLADCPAKGEYIPRCVRYPQAYHELLKYSSHRSRHDLYGLVYISVLEPQTESKLDADIGHDVRPTIYNAEALWVATKLVAQVNTAVKENKLVGVKGIVCLGPESLGNYRQPSSDRDDEKRFEYRNHTLRWIALSISRALSRGFKNGERVILWYAPTNHDTSRKAAQQVIWEAVPTAIIWCLKHSDECKPGFDIRDADYEEGPAFCPPLLHPETKQLSPISTSQQLADQGPFQGFTFWLRRQ